MFKLIIITPEKIAYEAEVTSIIAPGDLGYLGVLADHAPLITSLKTGKLEITDASGSKTTMTLNGGFLEVLKNNVTILADSIT
ncbi:MAG: ATP synthase F1 subunit epsilon [Nitrospirae bacterium]|nr:ATP synthase F1 subunit epsilon [Nitrospirota bacterium]